MQSPHATHLTLNFARSSAPGGRTGAGRSGTPGSDTGAKPPSVVFSTASAAARTATPLIASRRVAEEPSWSSELELESGIAFSPSPTLTSNFPPFPKHALQFAQPLPILWAQTLFLERRLKRVPTGQTQLHQTRPFPTAASTTTTAKTATPGQNRVNVFP